MTLMSPDLAVHSASLPHPGHALLAATLDWTARHATALALTSGFSVLFVIISLLATPWLVGRLPDDYFIAAPPRQRPANLLSVVRLLIGNIAGALLVLFGIVMLVTPGPGVVALLLGLMLCRFPGKHALLRHIAMRPGVFASLNRLRRHQGKSPFQPTGQTRR